MLSVPARGLSLLPFFGSSTIGGHGNSLALAQLVTSGVPGAECTPKDHRVKVVCIGASITKGNVRIFSGTASTRPYPTQLWEFLGHDYCVQNMGMPGTTVLKHSHRPYWKYKMVLKQIRDLKPDIVITQFGANDSKEPNVHTDFLGDYTDMVEFLKNISSRPRVYVMAPPPVYTFFKGRHVYGMDSQVVASLVEPLEEVSRATNIPLPISIYHAFRQRCPKLSDKCGWMSPDGVHPNADGDAVMAGLTYATIRGDDRCSLRKEEKQDCGFDHITQTQCKERGCCFAFGGFDGTPWCFKKATVKLASNEECIATDEQKTECGYAGISREQCKAAGCCWQETKLNGTPFCFHKVPEEFKKIFATTTSTTTTGSSSSSSISSTITSTITSMRATTTTQTSTPMPSRPSAPSVSTSTRIIIDPTFKTTASAFLPTTSTTTTSNASMAFILNSFTAEATAGIVVATLVCLFGIGCVVRCLRRNRSLPKPGPDRIPTQQVAGMSPGGGPQRSGNWRRARPTPFLTEEKAPLLPDTVSPTDGGGTPNGSHGGGSDTASQSKAWPMLPRAKTTPVIGEPTNNASVNRQKPRRRSSGGPGVKGIEASTGTATGHSAGELRRIPLKEVDEAAETETSASTAPQLRTTDSPYQAANVTQVATAPQLRTTDSPYQVDGKVANSTQLPSTSGNSAAEAQTATVATPAAADTAAAAAAAAAATSTHTLESELPQFGTHRATSSTEASGSSGHLALGSPPPPGWVVVNSPEPARGTIPAAAMSEGTAQRSSRGRSPPVQAASETVPPRSKSTTPRRSFTPPRTWRSSSVARGQSTQRGQGEATAEVASVAMSTAEAFPAADTSVQPPGGQILPPIALATADDNLVTTGTGGENTTAGGSRSHNTDLSTGGINSAEVAEPSLGISAPAGPNSGAAGSAGKALQ